MAGHERPKPSQRNSGRFAELLLWMGGHHLIAQAEFAVCRAPARVPRAGSRFGGKRRGKGLVVNRQLGPAAKRGGPIRHGRNRYLRPS